MIFKGVATALITPFKDGKLDCEALERLIDKLPQYADAVVALGTTGEPAALTQSEKDIVLNKVVSKLKGKMPIIVGTGNNCTDTSVKQALHAQQLGADALLIVTPYYNKCTQRGLAAHYLAIADAVNIPIICYNVPSRTGVNMLPSTFGQIAKHKNIAAIKEASGNMEQIEECIRLADGIADVYSGDDGLTLPTLAMGGAGIISVASNVTNEVKHMTDAFFGGDLPKARALQLKLLPLIRALFCEVNPIPVKYAAYIKNLCSAEVRLPLTELSKENVEALKNLFSE